MTVSNSEKELFFQNIVLQRYDADYKLRTLLTKIEGGFATETEQSEFAERFQSVRTHLISDLGKIEPNNYATEDLKLVMAMSDANYQRFINQNEPLVKISPIGKIQTILDGSSPDLKGFAGSIHDIDSLSPEQIIDQLGLKYTGTPYIVQDGATDIKQPMLLRVEIPIDAELKSNLKLPIEPRLLANIVKMAQSSNPEDSAWAKSYLDSYKDKTMLIVRNPADKDLPEVQNAVATLRSYYSNQNIKVADALEAPYTGTTAPMSADNQRAYTAVGQEMVLSSPIKPTSGWKISAVTAKAGVDPQRLDLPAGDKPVEIASFKNGQWQRNVSKDALQAMSDSAFAPLEKKYGKAVVQGWKKELGSVGDRIDKLKQKDPPEALKKHITDPKHNKKIKNGLPVKQRKTSKIRL